MEEITVDNMTNEEKLISRLKKNPFSTLEKAIYEILLESIVTFRYEPGTPLVELHLAKEFGVSRTPIRQAIQMLEEQGFVQKQENTKTIVAPHDAKEYDDMVKFRYIIEPAAAGFASKLITEEELADLKKYADDLHKAFVDKDYLQIIKYENLFHDLIVECSRNQYLIKAYSSISAYLTRMRAAYILAHIDEVDPDLYSEEHYLILNCIKLRNSDIAESVVRHLLMTFFPNSKSGDVAESKDVEYDSYKEVIKQQSSFFMNLTDK
ncbi:MAG: GntR family transcriptional regulator [Clostridiales bacterium]|nr:GntR family transcriptional regulator [Clostridiales bacterium]